MFTIFVCFCFCEKKEANCFSWLLQFSCCTYVACELPTVCDKWDFAKSHTIRQTTLKQHVIATVYWTYEVAATLVSFAAAFSFSVAFSLAFVFALSVASVSAAAAFSLIFSVFTLVLSFSDSVFLSLACEKEINSFERKSYRSFVSLNCITVVKNLVVIGFICLILMEMNWIRSFNANSFRIDRIRSNCLLLEVHGRNDKIERETDFFHENVPNNSFVWFFFFFDSLVIKRDST